MHVTGKMLLFVGIIGAIAIGLIASYIWSFYKTPSATGVALGISVEGCTGEGLNIRNVGNARVNATVFKILEANTEADLGLFVRVFELEPYRELKFFRIQNASDGSFTELRDAGSGYYFLFAPRVPPAFFRC